MLEISTLRTFHVAGEVILGLRVSTGGLNSIQIVDGRLGHIVPKFFPKHKTEVHLGAIIT
jgi:hypothetical protein